MEVCKIKCGSISRGGGAKQKTNKKIIKPLLCGTATPSVYFTYWNEVPGALVCPEATNKSAQHTASTLGHAKGCQDCAVGWNLCV